MNEQPIGVLDSGVGGLTIWKEIVKLLPWESTIYIADSKNCPYGVKSPEEIFAFSKHLVQFLVDKQCKLIVVACNTITVSCIDRLRSEFRGIPIIGTVPVVKTASEKSRSKRIGIYSTPVTATSQYQRDLINRFARECDVTNSGSNSLVSLIETGDLDSEELDTVLRRDLQAFKEAYIDLLVLGCSHFPLLRDKIQKIMGPGVLILDSGPAIARHVKRILVNNEIVAASTPLRQGYGGVLKKKQVFFTTGERNQFIKLLQLFVGKKVRGEDVHKTSSY